MDLQYAYSATADSLGRSASSSDLQAALLRAALASAQSSAGLYPATPQQYVHSSDVWNMEASQAHNLAEPSLNHPAGRLYELSTMQQALTPAHALLLEAELLKAAALQSMSNTLTAKRARLSALDAGLWEAASPAQDARQLQMELQHVLHAQQAELVARGLQQPVDRTRKREPSDNKRTRSGHRFRSHRAHAKQVPFTARQPAWAGSDWHPMAAVTAAASHSEAPKVGTGVFLPATAPATPAPMLSRSTSEVSITAPGGSPTLSSCSTAAPAYFADSAPRKSTQALNREAASTSSSFDLPRPVATKHLVLEGDSRSNSLASTLSSVSALSNDVTSDEGSYEGCCHSSEYAFLASGDYSFFEKVPPANICPSDPLQSLRWKAAQGALPDEWIY